MLKNGNVNIDVSLNKKNSNTFDFTNDNKQLLNEGIGESHIILPNVAEENSNENNIINDACVDRFNGIMKFDESVMNSQVQVKENDVKHTVCENKDLSNNIEPLSNGDETNGEENVSNNEENIERPHNEEQEIGVANDQNEDEVISNDEEIEVSDREQNEYVYHYVDLDHNNVQYIYDDELQGINEDLYIYIDEEIEVDEEQNIIIYEEMEDNNKNLYFSVDEEMEDQNREEYVSDDVVVDNNEEENVSNDEVVSNNEEQKVSNEEFEDQNEENEELVSDNAFKGYENDDRNIGYQYVLPLESIPGFMDGDTVDERMETDYISLEPSNAINKNNECEKIIDQDFESDVYGDNDGEEDPDAENAKLKINQLATTKTNSTDKIKYIPTTKNVQFPGYNEEVFKEIKNYVSNKDANEEVCPNVLTGSFALYVTDLLTLVIPNAWLNDKIINNYCILLVKNSDGNVLDFNTHFVSHLKSHGYNAVKSWTKKIDIFDCNKILIPVFLENHWTLLVVDILRSKVFFYNSMTQDLIEQVTVVIKYLCTEYKVKKGLDMMPDFWSIENGNSPFQHNFTDCGVFVCANARYAITDQTSNFDQDEVPLLRQKIAYELVNNTLFSF